MSQSNNVGGFALSTCVAQGVTIATAAVSGGTITVTPVAAGTCTLTVSGSGGQAAPLGVTVTTTSIVSQ